MKHLAIRLSVTFALLTNATLATNAQKPAPKNVHWPSFRGVRASGVAEGYKTPLTWNADTEDGKSLENLLWKTPLPGLSHGSPIVWGDRLFLATAVSGSGKDDLKVGLYGDIAPVEDDSVHTWKIYCLDKKTGKILWERLAHKGKPKVKRHTKATHANTTLATDGKYLVAFFGSEGLYCYDLNGKPLWNKNLGLLDSGYYMVPTAQWGFASSPILHKGSIIVQCDVQENSFLASYDAKTGNENWRTRRNEVPTWSTPTLAESNGRPQILVNGWKRIGGYDFETGKALWNMAGGGDIPVPTPVVGKGLAYITNAHGPMSPIYAVRLDASGDISLQGSQTSNASIAWFTRRGGAYMQTPLLYGDHLYVCRDNGVLACYDAQTGKHIYNERIGEGNYGFTASAIAADGKLYFTSEPGDIYVIKAGAKFELLAKNRMGEVCMATPALSEGVLYFRTQGHIVAIGTPPASK